MSKPRKKRYDAADVKAGAQAYGWKQVLESLTGHSIAKGPCPLCGGSDRLHLKKDFAETGAVHCRQCHYERNGDGLSFLMKANDGWDFPTTLQKVAELVGVDAIATNAKREANYRDQSWSSLLYASWGLHKPGITDVVNREGIEKASGSQSLYQDTRVIRVPVFDNGREVNQVALAMVRDLNVKDSKPVSKKVIGGKADGFSGYIPDAKTRILIKVEGYTDLLAMLSLDLPADVAVVTNPFGCSSKPKRSVIEPIAIKADEVWIFHDCDAAGQNGAERWSNEFSKFTPTKNVVLPYPIEDSKGKDLRDWISEGNNGFAELEKLAAAVDAIEAVHPDDTDDLLIADDCPHRLAEINLKFYHDQGGRLAYWKSRWWKFKQGSWRSIEVDELKAKISPVIKAEFQRCWLKERSESSEPESMPPVRKVTRQIIINVVDAMASLTLIPNSIEMPCWLPDRSRRELLNCQNGLLNIERLLAGAEQEEFLANHSPDWFDVSKLGYDFDGNAECDQWRKFIADSFGNDMEQIEAIQRWFGYCLTRQTHLQKILFIVGPKRSGKGTILRTLTALLGVDSVCSPTSDSLAEQFGLMPLLGRKVAMISDARFSGRNSSVVTERLLSISGEDRISVPIKHRTAITTKLDTRFVIVSNELPKFSDNSGALASRLICLETPNSYYDREDTNLDAKLRTELPGILLWSLAGLANLNRERKIIQPTATKEERTELLELSSPVVAFANDCCKLDPDVAVDLERLYNAYKQWCKDEGRNHPKTKSVFSRDLNASNEKISRVRKYEDGSKVTKFSGIDLNQKWRKFTAAFV